jgi:hypothetical protein
MRSLFNHYTIRQYSNAVSIFDSRKLMRYDQSRAILGYSIKRLLYNLLSLRIKCTRGLVE